LRQFFCRQYFRDFQEWFGEMESTDGACSVKWSRIVCTAERRGFLRDGQKSGNHVREKRLPSKTDIKRITPPETTLFAHFFPIFITFYISQHYGRHVTTSMRRHPEHKGNPAEIGRADAEEVMMFLFFKSKAGFSKLDIYFCPFLKTGGRNVKKTSTSSLRA
jgi:hypothetical protein